MRVRESCIARGHFLRMQGRGRMVEDSDTMSCVKGGETRPKARCENSSKEYASSIGDGSIPWEFMAANRTEGDSQVDSFFCFTQPAHHTAYYVKVSWREGLL